MSSYLAVSPLPSLLPAVRRFDLCGTFPVLADGGRYPPPCPWEPGLSSRNAKLPAAARGPGARTLVRQWTRARKNSEHVRRGAKRFCGTGASPSVRGLSPQVRFLSAGSMRRAFACMQRVEIASLRALAGYPVPRPSPRVQSPSPGGSLVSRTMLRRAAALFPSPGTSSQRCAAVRATTRGRCFVGIGACARSGTSCRVVDVDHHSDVGRRVAFAKERDGDSVDLDRRSGAWAAAARRLADGLVCIGAASRWFGAGLTFRAL